MRFKRDSAQAGHIRARHQQVSRTMHRFHAMTDPFLTRNLLILTRAARREAPDRFGDPRTSGYDALLLWQVIPLLAKRVGGCVLLPNEGTDPDIIQKTDVELRNLVGVCLNNTTLDRVAHAVRGEDKARVLSLDVLAHGFVNGNPIAMVADRLCAPAPADDDAHDWLARHIREISRNRFGDERFSAWSPEFQYYARDDKQFLAHFADDETSCGPDI